MLEITPSHSQLYPFAWRTSLHTSPHQRFTSNTLIFQAGDIIGNLFFGWESC